MRDRAQPQPRAQHDTDDEPAVDPRRTSAIVPSSGTAPGSIAPSDGQVAPSADPAEPMPSIAPLAALPLPTLDDPFAIGEALYDPARQEEGLGPSWP